MKLFWNNLKKPFFVMAPMADVTDVAFRALVAKRGAPDVFWTEFVSADGLYHTREVAKMKDEENPLMRDLVIGEGQRPIIAQIFSNKSEMIAYATKLVAELGFDGVDINMGCPDRSIEKQGSGAAMMKTPEVARAVIRAAKEAAEGLTKSQHGFGNSGLRKSEHSFPVSVKTRVGYNKESLDEWLPVILEEAPAAITLHLRTRKEMSLVPANWELMKRAVELRDKISPETRIIGNGDVTSVEQGRQLALETGCDGIMIGRGMFGNPWVFEGIRDSGLTKSRHAEVVGLESTTSIAMLGLRKSPHSEHSLEEKLAALVELAHNFEKITPAKNFAILKKHIKAFVTGFAGAAELRARLMEAESAAELEKIIAGASVK